MKLTSPPLWIGIGMLVTGCAQVAVDPRAGALATGAIVKDRLGHDIVLDEHGPEDRDPSAKLRDLLAKGLTVERAVAVALLTNREIQAVYSDIGVAQSDVVQSSLLHNPVLGAGASIPVAGGLVDVSLALAVDVVDVLFVPLRKRVAESLYEETKLRVAAEVLDLAWRTQTAFYRHQANEQLLEIRRAIVEAAAASAEITRRMRAAGNTTELASESEAAFEASARLDLRLAEIAGRESREELNQRLGLWGSDAEWTLTSTRLPDPPPDAPEVTRLESRVVAASLDLAMADLGVAAAAAQRDLNAVSGLFPEILVGATGDRRGKSWEPGPSLSLALPIFDRGQARRARADAELRRAREAEYALAVHLRAVTRSTRDRVLGHRERALFYRDVALPLRARVVRQTGLQYNAMQTGPVELLRAKQQEVEAGLGYVESLRDYWLAQSDLGLLLAGRLPSMAPAPASPAIESPRRSPIPTLG